ncbi:MAG: siderophore-interacting protein [Paracoccus sp. (in: a-proteobacteria)]
MTLIMRHDAQLPFQAEALLSVPFEHMDELIRQQASEHGLELRSDAAGSIWLRIGQGEFGVMSNDTGCMVCARAESCDWLFTLQEAVTYHVQDRFGISLRWAGAERVGQFPPNFSLARVVSVRPLGAYFLRLRIEGQNLGRFARDMIHFRIVLPHPDQPTVWPELSDVGQTCWPQDLHRPAYTVSTIDAEAGWLETDVFIHEGGRVCNFVAQSGVGTEIGLTGPGGGGVPRATDRLLIGGDETAYPALSRIIAAQAREVRIDCHLFGDVSDYPFASHPGLYLSHTPGAENCLADNLDRTGIVADKVWFATERTRLQRLKQAVLCHLPKDRAHLAAYWTATGR